MRNSSEFSSSGTPHYMVDSIRCLMNLRRSSGSFLPTKFWSRLFFHVSDSYVFISCWCFFFLLLRVRSPCLISTCIIEEVHTVETASSITYNSQSMTQPTAQVLPKLQSSHVFDVSQRYVPLHTSPHLTRCQQDSQRLRSSDPDCQSPNRADSLLRSTKSTHQ